MPITVLIADDHQILREGLRSLLEMQGEHFDIVAEAEDGLTAVQFAKEYTPDLVLIDISMPVLNGIDATRDITAKSPHCKVLVLSMHADKEYVINSLKAGAAGYLLKDVAFSELTTAIAVVMAGKLYLSPSIAGVVGHYLRHPEQVDLPAPDQLGERERQVLRLLAEGKASKEIAQIMRVSIKTVDSYRQQLMQKLQLHSIAELTKYAIRTGISPL
jgi:DNA-binding NarL/FixJ family response regulator